MLDDLRAQVCAANLALVEHGLVTLTWGNVSGIDRDQGVFAIKPSGVPYRGMSPDDMVLVDLDGKVVEDEGERQRAVGRGSKGSLRPSSDTPTHLALYRAFDAIGGVAHTHSTHATALCQARRPLPCLGTTHADHFAGTVPLTRQLTPDEVRDDYEGNTGTVIVESFADLEPREIPAVLVAGHGPFTWGADARTAVDNAVALDACARMALLSGLLDGTPPRLETHLLRQHHERKHGPHAYYGQ
jgi:L-ribulose-5-phosphate 4-epimerase